jgi:hypothetical protein
MAFIDRGRKGFVIGSHVLGGIDYVKGPLPTITENDISIDP